MHSENAPVSRWAAVALVAGVAGSASFCSDEQLEEASSTAAFYVYDLAFGGAVTRAASEPLAHSEQSQCGDGAF
jgi:N-methylhydantoinase B/oxoprolinase/acetone carboxylase alpha subunit